MEETTTPLAHRDIYRSGDYHDIEVERGAVTRVFRDGSYYFDSKQGQRTRVGFMPSEDDPDQRVLLLEEQVRFFKAALGVEGEGTPQDIIHAAVAVLDERPETRLMLRHIVEQGNRYEREQRRATKLHETLLHVSTVVAATLERLAEPAAPVPPKWLLAMANAIDLALAEAALERRAQPDSGRPEGL